MIQILYTTFDKKTLLRLDRSIWRIHGKPWCFIFFSTGNPSSSISTFLFYRMGIPFSHVIITWSQNQCFTESSDQIGKKKRSFLFKTLLCLLYFLSSFPNFLRSTSFLLNTCVPCSGVYSWRRRLLLNVWVWIGLGRSSNFVRSPCLFSVGSYSHSNPSNSLQQVPLLFLASWLSLKSELHMIWLTKLSVELNWFLPFHVILILCELWWMFLNMIA